MIVEVAASPIPIVAAPNAVIRRGPKRSARCPVKGPSRNETHEVIEKIADVVCGVLGYRPVGCCGAVPAQMDHVCDVAERLGTLVGA